MVLSTQTSFPSQKSIEAIGKLRSIDATPTQFKGMTAEEIAEEINSNLDGSITIDLSKAPEAERAPIREAANIDIDGEKPSITILGDNGEASEEDQILRDINAEMLEDSKVNIGRIAFRRFIKVLLEDPNNYPLVRDEWNLYIVGHDKTGKIDSPYEAHHLHNVGLKQRSEGEDPLREQMIGFVKGVMEEFREKVADLFENDEIVEHPKEGMNTLDARLLALGLAELSNFIRRAGYHRYRRGEKSLEAYAPGRLAADIIDEVIAEHPPA